MAPQTNYLCSYKVESNQLFTFTKYYNFYKKCRQKETVGVSSWKSDMKENSFDGIALI